MARRSLFVLVMLLVTVTAAPAYAQWFRRGSSTTGAQGAARNGGQAGTRSFFNRNPAVRAASTLSRMTNMLRPRTFNIRPSRFAGAGFNMRMNQAFTRIGVLWRATGPRFTAQVTRLATPTTPRLARDSAFVRTTSHFDDRSSAIPNARVR